MSFPLRLVWFYLLIAPHVLLIPIAVVMFSVLFPMYALKMPGATVMSVDRLARGGDVTFHFGIIQVMFESPFANIMPMRRAMGRIFSVLTLIFIVLAMTFIEI